MSLDIRLKNTKHDDIEEKFHIFLSIKDIIIKSAEAKDNIIYITFLNDIKKKLLLDILSDKSLFIIEYEEIEKMSKATIIMVLRSCSLYLRKNDNSFYIRYKIKRDYDDRDLSLRRDLKIARIATNLTFGELS